MKVHRIRGGNRKALEAKKYNIGVPISLGNKWFSVENIIELIRWSLLYIHKEVVVYVADTIHAINLEVRNKISKDRALRIAKRKGQEMLKNIENAVKETFSPQEQEKIVYATWDDLVDDSYKRKVAYLYGLYKTNREFKSRIISIIQDGTSHEKRTFNQKETDLLGTYILEELPEMIARISIKGVVYDANVYPFDGEICKLAEDIQLGKFLPEIKEILLDTEPKVFLEVRYAET